ncbi:SDR family NAD(P)-dependent oxidoreductase [Longivirga aurantiaca]|uniref:SDR family NAD(P)-dependent oxidoreductase n=1 Tax=Longivirga aurantiaca TaxID=1837743 RepID=A0ABW1T3S3_9ACTN
MKRYVVDGGTAVLTGAAGGIGRATAHELAARGSNLVLLDNNAEALEDVAADLRVRRPDRAVTAYTVDLADGDAALAAATAIRDAHPNIHLLVNNAGVALGGRLSQISLDDFDWLMSVNFRAVVVMTHTLLPRLTATRGAHVCNVSSLFGLIGPAGQTAYSASKFAVRGFGDSLRLELAEHEVGVTTVHPGGIRTEIANSARVGAGVDQEEHAAHKAVWDRMLSLDPAVAARAIVDGIERRKPRVLIGRETYALDALARLSPGHYGRVLALGDRLMTRGLDR